MGTFRHLTSHKISDRWRGRTLLFTLSFVVGTPSPPGSVALFPQGFAFYVSHHHSLHSSFDLAAQRSAVRCSAWLGVIVMSRVTRYKQQWQILGSGLFGHSFRSGFNQLCNSVWLRHVNRVAARYLDDCRTSALCHETLRRRWDHLVLGGDQIPTRLSPPCRMTDRSIECFGAPRDLRISHEGGFSASTSAANEEGNFVWSRNR